ncbi:MAG TPA: DUF3810 domain-containing protein [Blastocatellia bacterium]
MNNRQKKAVRGLIIEVAIIVVGFGVYLLPPSSAWVELHYSRGIYPKIQRTITPLTNIVPFAVADVLIISLVVGLVIWWVRRFRRARQGRRLKAIGAMVFHTLVLAAVAVFVFQVIWGLNYSRVPLIEKLDYDKGRITDQAVGEIANECVAQLNLASAQVHAAPWPDTHQWGEIIKPSYESVISDLGVSGGIVPGRIKHSIFNFYLAASGIDGFINPYGLESILNSHLLPVEQPFAMAHEWSHLAGFADESEANFIALLTCLRSPDPAVQYAGWLALYPNLPASVFHNEQDESKLKLDPQVVADLRAIYQQQQKDIRPWVNAAQWHFYDRFLKANHVTAGVASYGLFLRLLAGTRFEANWTPATAPSER